MRNYTFNLNELVEDIMCKPWENNVTLGDKYNISRERVRQIRIMKNLPTVNEAKIKWFEDNFDMFVGYAQKGKFITNVTFMKRFPVSTRLVLKSFENKPSLERRYQVEGLEVFNERVYYPTSKACLICKEDVEINKFYKSPTDRTRDGYARVCISCNKANVKKHYEKRKTTVKVIPDYKFCSAVPEVGKLPKEEFRKMTTSTTGLQPQCSVYQDFFIKFRKSNQASDARDLARQATIWYYEKV